MSDLIETEYTIESVGTTVSHTQKQTFCIEEWFPDHAPRASDPHYAIFNATRKRLAALGALKCWRCGDKDGDPTKDANGIDGKVQVELHHSLVEFSLANAVDVSKFASLYPELHITDDETFLRFIEGEGNLLPLCVKCHRGRQGIHSLPYPCWLPGRFQKVGTPPLAVVIPRYEAQVFSAMETDAELDVNEMLMQGGGALELVTKTTAPTHLT